MALSGIVKKDFHKSGVFTLQIEWEAVQSVVDNTSTITARMYLISNTDGGTISSSVGKNGKIIIDGTTYNHSGINVNLSAHQKKLLATSVKTVTHNPDGTKSFTISGNLDIQVTLSGTYYGTVSITGATFTLDTIPRASTITSFPNFTIGNSFNVSINRASSSFTHKLELKYGSTLIATRTGIGASTTFTLTTPEENALYNVMKNVTSGTVTLYCTTYSGGTKIGSTTSKTATASVSSSIVPSFDTITHSDVSTDIASVFGAYIQGKSRLNLAITGAAGAKYSTIVSYKIEFNQEIYNSRTAVSGYIKGSGTLSIKGTVTDSRGRSYSKTIAINVLAYAPPKINSFRVDRCNADGSPNPSGEYAKVTISGECKSLNSKNTIQLTISSKTRNVSSYTTKQTDTPEPVFTEEYIIGIYDTSVSYDFRARLEDYFEKAESTVVLGTAKVVFHLGREGIGTGKIWERGALDVQGDVYIEDGDIHVGGTTFLSHIENFNSHQAENANQAHGGFKGAKIGLSSNVSLTANAQILINWNTIDYDDSGFFTLSTPTRLTIPNGVSKVRLIVALEFASNAEGARAIYLQKNNSSFLASSQRASTNVSTRMQLVTPVLLVQEGDFFNVLAQQFSGTTLNLLSSGNTYFALEVVE